MKLIIKDNFKIIKTKPGKKIQGNGMKVIKPTDKDCENAIKEQLKQFYNQYNHKKKL